MYTKKYYYIFKWPTISYSEVTNQLTRPVVSFKTLVSILSVFDNIITNFYMFEFKQKSSENYLILRKIYLSQILSNTLLSKKIAKTCYEKDPPLQY